MRRFAACTRRDLEPCRDRRGRTSNPIVWLRMNESSQSLVAQDEFNQYDGIYDGGKPGVAPQRRTESAARRPQPSMASMIISISERSMLQEAL